MKKRRERLKLHLVFSLAIEDPGEGRGGICVHVDVDKRAYKDTVYFSMHKFVGGPDSPGMPSQHIQVGEAA